MKIATYNLNGIRSALNKGWLDWLTDNDFDIVCVQELKAQEDQIDKALFEAAGYHVYIHAAEKKGYSGVAIFSKKEADQIEIGCGYPDFDREGRVIRADFGSLAVYSIYFPSGTTGNIRQGVKYQFLDHMFDFLHAAKKQKPGLVICGDYNIAHQEIDIHDPKSNKQSSGFLPEERAWMDKWFASGFSDGFRLINQDAHQYTWWSFRANARANNKGWRIDYISVSASLTDRVRHATIMPDAIHSDHCPMMIELAE